MFDVSIIIPVYKAKYTIKKTLESINNQKFKNKIPKIELILSIDDNKNYEKEYANKNFHHFWVVSW